ncbi:DUF6270 domain-containing protein [uncultured Serinicoccus sp.]|uniref:DUF6270 domain-containing protein n=1 Tax=uncultured Serinicoccus sp. TaxID=735514 RepID=UPI002612FEB7|nr:DUF6270 domain-containing protein [uncultured Serinicoccus sp.]
MSVRTFIYGSCVSRDTFERLPEGFELVSYVARQSLISAFTPPSARGVPAIDTDSEFQRRMIVGDWESSLPAQLRQHADGIDLLLWDLCDERVGLRRLERVGARPTAHAWGTRSVDSIRAGVDAQLDSSRLVAFASARHRVLFLHALRRFRALLDELGLRERTLLLAPAWATRTSDGESVPTSFGLDPDRANRLFRDYHRTATRVTDVAAAHVGEVAADAGHPWGVAPFHYTESVYCSLAGQVIDAAEPSAARPEGVRLEVRGKDADLPAATSAESPAPPSEEEVVVDLVGSLVHDPASLWTGDRSHMSLRQQGLLEKFQARNALRDLDEVQVAVLRWARSRAGDRPMTYFVVNPGGAGSHWLQEMMADAGGMNPCGEVYLPPGMTSAAASLGDEARGLLLDAVHLLQANRPVADLLDAPLINTAHIRGWHQHELMPAPKSLVLLTRDPLDVVLSRTFRKQAYRTQHFAGESDETYLRRNIDFVQKFYLRGEGTTPDASVRYEDLRADAPGTISRLGRALGVDLEGPRALEVDARGGSNKYAGPAVEISPHLRQLAADELAELRERLGYLEAAPAVTDGPAST